MLAFELCCIVFLFTGLVQVFSLYVSNITEQNCIHRNDVCTVRRVPASVLYSQCFVAVTRVASMKIQFQSLRTVINKRFMTCLFISGMKCVRQTDVSTAIPLAGAAALSERMGIGREGAVVPFPQDSNTDSFTVFVLLTDATQSTFLSMMHVSELMRSHEWRAS